MSYDIITFGSATQDIFVKSSAFKTASNPADFITGKGICLNAGSKIELEDIIFATGGGGTNTAATFAKQGFKTAFCGAIGADASGLGIVRELKKLKIDTKFVVKKKEKHTNHSIIISVPGQDATVLVYREASDLLCLPDGRQATKLAKTKWFYIAPLSGDMLQKFSWLVDFANENGIKVAVNPSKQQLQIPQEKLRNILQKVDVLFLNQEEASILTKISFEKEKEIFKKIDEICPGIAVMTRGSEGVVVSDGRFLYSAKPDPNRKIVDTAGAGDSFAAGFLSDYIKHDGNIEKAIQLGLANSAANLAAVGAKNGILEKDAEFVRAKVEKVEC